MGKATSAPVVLSVLVALTGVGCGILGGGAPFSEKESRLRPLLPSGRLLHRGRLQAEGPKVLLKVANAGSQYHELEVVDDQGKRVGRVPPFPVGMTLRPLYLKLKAGTYTLQCTIKNQDGKAHKDLGMTTKLVVQ